MPLARHWTPAVCFSRQEAKLVRSGQPALAVGRHELVVVQVRIGVMHAREFVGLPRAQPFVRIEAPRPFQQALPTQDLVAANKQRWLA